MKTDLRLSVLGPMRAWRGEAQLDLGPVRQQAMLAALVLRPDITVSQQELLDDVWGLRPPGTGRKVIPGYVHRLRNCLVADRSGSVIGSERGGYRFVSDGVGVDAARLGELVVEATAAMESGDPRTAGETWSRALALFRGEPLAGIPGPFAEGERFRLTERRMTLLRAKLDCRLRLGRYEEAAVELSALTATHPHSEPLAGLLMRAFYGCGRQADALRVYTETRRRLVDDLAVEPGAELRRVHEAVLRGDDLYLLGTTAPRTRAGSLTAGHPGRGRCELPAAVVDLVGRDREAAVLAGPGETGAVTVRSVDGMPGVGKTALAVRAAWLMSGRHPAGSLFVDLHGHSRDRGPLTPQRALRRLLRAVGGDDTSDDLDELVASWRVATAPLRLMLILDDASSAEQVRPLLPTGAGSSVIVTSRRRLAGLDLDLRISASPLELEAAVGLLTRVVGSGRAAGEPSAVRELAERCGRLPLALRIAAARLQNHPAWTFASFAARLADEGRLFDELTAEDRSVEAAFRLSYDRLPDAARRTFRALGGQRVLGPDTRRVLEILVDASLLQEPTAGHYRLDDLVAAYARKLATEGERP